MRYFFKTVKCKESTTTFEGMHRSEDVTDELLVFWRLLKLNKVNIELVEYLASLEQELI
jgi:hypothetical protein